MFINWWTGDWRGLQEPSPGVHPGTTLQDLLILSSLPDSNIKNVVKSSSVHQLRAFWVPGSWAQLLWQWSPPFLAAGTSFTEDSSSMHWGAGRVVSERCAHIKSTVHFASSLLSLLIRQEGRPVAWRLGAPGVKDHPQPVSTPCMPPSRNAVPASSRGTCWPPGGTWTGKLARTEGSTCQLLRSLPLVARQHRAYEKSRRGPERGNEKKKACFCSSPPPL